MQNFRTKIPFQLDVPRIENEISSGPHSKASLVGNSQGRDWNARVKVRAVERELRIGSWQNGFLAAAVSFSRILSPDCFSSLFVPKSAPTVPSGKSPAKCSKFCTKKSPTHFLKGGEKTPTPKISALLRKRPVLLRANVVLTKDRKRPYYGHFCGKMHREGSCSKAAGVP